MAFNEPVSMIRRHCAFAIGVYSLAGASRQVLSLAMLALVGVVSVTSAAADTAPVEIINGDSVAIVFDIKTDSSAWQALEIPPGESFTLILSDVRFPTSTGTVYTPVNPFAHSFVFDNLGVPLLLEGVNSPSSKMLGLCTVYVLLLLGCFVGHGFYSGLQQ